MPVNVVKTMTDERAWKRAKESVGSKAGDSDRHRRMVMAIFQKMRNKSKK